MPYLFPLLCPACFCKTYRAHQYLHSFPTRRSSDLLVPDQLDKYWQHSLEFLRIARQAWPAHLEDRKSTRLNSSHRCISYAVFCLKKKTGDVVNTASRLQSAAPVDGVIVGRETDWTT